MPVLSIRSSDPNSDHTITAELTFRTRRRSHHSSDPNSDHTVHLSRVGGSLSLIAPPVGAAADCSTLAPLSRPKLRSHVKIRNDVEKLWRSRPPLRSHGRCRTYASDVGASRTALQTYSPITRVHRQRRHDREDSRTPLQTYSPITPASSAACCKGGSSRTPLQTYSPITQGKPAYLILRGATRTVLQTYSPITLLDHTTSKSSHRSRPTLRSHSTWLSISHRSSDHSPITRRNGSPTLFRPTSDYTLHVRLIGVDVPRSHRSSDPTSDHTCRPSHRSSYRPEPRLHYVSRGLTQPPITHRSQLTPCHRAPSHRSSDPSDHTCGAILTQTPITRDVPQDPNSDHTATSARSSDPPSDHTCEGRPDLGHPTRSSDHSPITHRQCALPQQTHPPIPQGHQ